MPPPSAVQGAGIDNTKMTWGTATITTRVYSWRYAVRVDGEFTGDKMISSGYEIQTASSNNTNPSVNLDLRWLAGSPSSTASKTIGATGSYLGFPNANKVGIVMAIPVSGGPQSSTVMKLDNPLAGKWISDPVISVPTGGIMYSVFGVANDNGANGGLTFCTPYATKQVMP